MNYSPSFLNGRYKLKIGSEQTPPDPRRWVRQAVRKFGDLRAEAADPSPGRKKNRRPGEGGGGGKV